MTTYHLVEADLARARAPLDDPTMKGFVEHLEEIDELASRWPGFIDQPTLPDAGSCCKEPDILNVSIWESVGPLREFTYTSKHGEMLKRRDEWFVRTNRPAYVLFWSPAGTVQREEDVMRRFEYLDLHGPTPYAFTFDLPYTVEEMLGFCDQEGLVGPT